MTGGGTIPGCMPGGPAPMGGCMAGGNGPLACRPGGLGGLGPPLEMNPGRGGCILGGMPGAYMPPGCIGMAPAQQVTAGVRRSGRQHGTVPMPVRIGQPQLAWWVVSQRSGRHAWQDGKISCTLNACSWLGSSGLWEKASPHCVYRAGCTGQEDCNCIRLVMDAATAKMCCLAHEWLLSDFRGLLQTQALPLNGLTCSAGAACEPVPGGAAAGAGGGPLGGLGAGTGAARSCELMSSASVAVPATST